MTQSSLFNKPEETIKVGYIDPIRGYVDGVTVCEANEYAELNPGTTFIFRDGNDNIRYLRIKQVNELTTNDLIRTKECDPDFKKCGPPKIQIFGGGGIGAAANPIISPVSGAIIAADLVRGGHGYKIEPFAQAIDPCNRGAGAVFETRVGIVTTEEEVFDKEDDFEDYKICPDNTVNPRIWGPDGEDLGEWNPDKYFNVDKDQDPIQLEIEKYQKFLKEYKNPWWDSRKKSPRLVTGDGKSFNKVYPVTHIGVGISTKTVELKTDNPSPQPVSAIQEVTFNLYRSNGMPSNPNGGISNIQVTFTPISGEGQPFSFVNDTPNKKIVQKKVSIHKNTVYKVTSTLTETAKDKHEIVEQGTLESRNNESTSWSRGTGGAAYKELNKPSTVMFADALPTANDNDDFVISVPTGFGVFKTKNKTKVTTQDGSQSRNTWEIEYVLESPTAPPTNTDTNPNLKAKFVKKDGGIYLDTTGFSGNVEIDLSFLIADSLKGGDGYAALNFQIPGTSIVFNRKDPATGKVKDNEKVQKKYTVEGGKLYGPVVFSGGASNSVYDLASDTTISSLDPKSASELNRERTNINTAERDFDVVINSSRGNARKSSPTLIGISTEFRYRTWNDFMNTYAVSPVPDSTLPGSDFPNTLFSIEWEENFPYAGEYIFRGCKDNTAQLYIDNVFITELQNFNEEPKAVPVQMTEGNHVIRVDLLNFPIKEKVITNNFTPNPSPSVSKDKKKTTKDESTSKSSGPNSRTTSTKTDSESTVTKVFNTVDYITKANRPLWRTNPSATSTSSIIDRFGISPFDTKTAEAQTTSYAGTHEIIWENINFPVDGFYRISVAVDDNVTIWIGNRGSGGTANDGSGRIAQEGDVGDEVILRHEGFYAPSKSRGDLLTTKFFKAGSYRIRADLEQIEGKAIAKGNPMALAINIETSYAEQEIIASRSWQQNPMGVALTIQAPEIPLPQEKPPAQIGRCPTNPLWTTRFPNARQKWYPVRYTGSEVTDIKVNADEFKSENQPKNDISLTEEVELTLYRANGMQASADGDRSNIFVKLEPIQGEGEAITLTNDLDNKVPTKKKITIYKNTVYKVTSGLTPNAKPKHETVEQGTLELRESENSNTPWAKGDKQKYKEFNKPSSVLFVDALPTANDNDDFVITLPKGKGEFRPGKKTKVKTQSGDQNRNTWEITYVLEAPVTTKDTITSSNTTGGGEPTTKVVTTTKRVTRTSGWSKFTNRYAISPVPPLGSRGSDKAGITFSNTWDVDIPFTAFYAFKATADNEGRILIDGEEIMKAEHFLTESPKSVKKKIEKGRHQLTVEVFNKPQFVTTTTRQKVFSTQDWQVKKAEEKAKTVNVQFSLATAATYVNRLEIEGVFNEVGPSYESGSKIPNQLKKTISADIQVGKVYNVVVRNEDKKSPKMNLRSKGQLLEVEDSTDFNWTDYLCSASVGRFYDVNGDKCKFVVDADPPATTSTRTINGVTYEGPELFAYKHSAWSDFMNAYSISPVTTSSDLVGDKTLLWKNVNFPITAQYLIEIQADNIAKLKIGGKEVHRTVDFRNKVTPFFASVSKGTYDIEILLTNSPPVGLNQENQTFDENPTGVACIITVDVTNRSINSLAWQDDNPMGISAIMIAPPCPKPTAGKGVVTDIIPTDPGNGYTPPIPTPQTYPVTLTMPEVIVTNPGINYNCGVDEIVVTPSNGAQLDYVCDSFGRINRIVVTNPGLGFTFLPQIDIISSTGINFSAIPVLKPVRDPIGVAEDKLIQVTDLVGLKQTGYINGRAYYGAVFFEDGVKYAGYYRTAGDLVQVYDTLQESIDATVTTVPSAIERSGTDPGSNNTRLNIPGTPENLRDLNQ